MRHETRQEEVAVHQRGIHGRPVAADLAKAIRIDGGGPVSCTLTATHRVNTIHCREREYRGGSCNALAAAHREQSNDDRYRDDKEQCNVRFYQIEQFDAHRGKRHGAKDGRGEDRAKQSSFLARNFQPASSDKRRQLAPLLRPTTPAPPTSSRFLHF